MDSIFIDYSVCTASSNHAMHSPNQTRHHTSHINPIII